ncbi:hypothetical protein HHK36_004731 [Tetracentron sinense]|uniref:Uncharacterized protein n=1 Tax=Tetracentron sinense TaxID=13715 RepID=A0A834ZP40_TETSI|nr:hypothetical protein HHK36_004731 [Tetracentron sinense]
MAKTVSSLHTGLCSCAAPDPDYMVTLSKGGFLVFSPSDPSSINKLNSSVSRNYPPLISDMVSKPLNVPKEMIVGKFNIESEDTKKWVAKKLGSCWREWKHSNKKRYFAPGMPVQEQYRYRDSRVDPQQWRELVDYNRSEEGKAISARNKANRQKLKMSHTGGTKPFARYRAEEARLTAEMEALRSQVRRMNQALESFGRHLGNTFLSSDSDDTQPPDDTQG